MKRTISIFISTLAITSSHICYAVDEYDITSHCQHISEISGGSYTLEKACRDREESAKARVEGAYVPDRINEHCGNLAKHTQSYTLYEACIEREQKAADELR